MLLGILGGVAAVVVIFVIVAATRPAAYHIERKIDVAASADAVFAVLNDLQRFANVWVIFGEPWATIDPAMKKTFDGPTSGVGQSVAWSGKSDVGQGTLTIAESVPAQRVGMKLEFVKPMASKATHAFTLSPPPSSPSSSSPSSSSVTWAMDGNHNFVGKAFGIFVNMDKMLGADMEKSLARLKDAAEGR